MEKTKVTKEGSTWVVWVWSDSVKNWIAQGEWTSEEDAERDAQNWKESKQFEITEDFQIPGTEIILEKGDSIRLRESFFADRAIREIAKIVTDYTKPDDDDDDVEGARMVGTAFIKELSTYMDMYQDEELTNQFLLGVKNGFQDLI